MKLVFDSHFIPVHNSIPPGSHVSCTLGRAGRGNGMLFSMLIVNYLLMDVQYPTCWRVGHTPMLQLSFPYCLIQAEEHLAVYRCLSDAKIGEFYICYRIRAVNTLSVGGHDCQEPATSLPVSNRRADDIVLSLRSSAVGLISNMDVLQTPLIRSYDGQ